MKTNMHLYLQSHLALTLGATCFYCSWNEIKVKHILLLVIPY